MDNVNVVTLGSICEGAALERFQEELKKVCENIMDPNTEADAVREIKLTVKIAPDDNRESASVEISTGSKLASFKPVHTRIYVTRHHGDLVAVESNPKQLGLGLEPNKPNVTAIDGGKKE